MLAGRAAEARPGSPKELKGTTVLSLPLTEASVKVRTGPPVDEDDDLGLDVWAGVVPLRTVVGTPEPSPDLAAGITLPPSIVGLRSAEV